MKLQSKVILITAITWVIICAIILIDSKLTISPEFKQLESKLNEHEIEDTKHAYEKMLSTLTLYSQAFSQWDEAYDFMKNKNQKFINSNFVAGTYTSSDINFLIYYDINNQLYYGRTYDKNKDLLQPIPDSLIQFLNENPEFLSHNNTKDNKVGILNTAGGLVIMSSLPVLTSTGDGPIRGSLLMGYYLEEKHFNNISNIVGLKLKLHPFSFISKKPFILSKFKNLNFKNEISQININDKMTYGFILLNDINRKPVGILQIDIPRDVYLQGISTTYHYLTIVIVLGLFVMLLSWFLLKIFVIDRILGIGNQVTKINLEKKFNQKILISGDDELSSMVNSINNMMRIIFYSQNQLRHLATHDSLTQLPNRKYFYDLLQQEIIQTRQTGKKFAVMFLDLDKFKKVNDSYGHAVGDKLIQYVTKRILKNIRKTDILARQSGDEFLLCLRDIKNNNFVIESANRIITATLTPFSIDHINIEIGLSIGISIYPDDADTVEELIQCADKVMYNVKGKSGNFYEFFNQNHNF